MDLISVIVPVYKVEKYLRRCVDSILVQTYTNLEIILVDDGSPDNCPAICDEYAKKESRIKVIHKPNGGLSSARNAGLDAANGKYIGFVDSDDYIASNMYEVLYRLVTENKSQMAVCNCFFVDEFDNVLFRQSPLKDETVSGIEAVRHLQEKNGINFITCWNRIYERDLFSSIRFPLNKLCEDNYIAHSLYHKCQRVSFTGEQLYYYVQRKGSILNSSVSVKSFDETEGFFRRIEYLNEHEINDNPQAHSDLFLNSYTHFKMLFYPRTKSEKARIKEINAMAKSVFKGAYKHCGVKNAVITVLPFSVLHLLLKLMQFLMIFLLGIKQKYCNCILMNLPKYDNLGDQAIALSEIRLFKKYHIPVIKIEELYVQLFPDLLNHIGKNKTIIISGGGFIGNLWPENETKYVSGIIERFKENRILIFPQSVTFDINSHSGKKYFDFLSAIYQSHNNLELLVRERKSFDFVRQYMPQIKVCLVPDVVLLLETDLSEVREKKILFCMRNDHERRVNDMESVQAGLRGKYPDFVITEADNLLGNTILPFFRKKEVFKQLRQFSSARLVVTDRLHGMIFAAVTNTPCIAFDNANGKVSGVYEWIKNNEFISLCRTADDVRAAIDSMDLTAEYHLDRAEILESSKPLFDAIKESI